MNICRSEHPSPQLRRDAWESLNGMWEFAIDRQLSGKERGLIESEHLDRTIRVPFCPESVLSGIGDTDFLNCVWYKKHLTFDREAIGDKRVLLHVGACDYVCEVYLNARPVGRHVGPFAPLVCDITDAIRNGDNLLTIRAEDDPRAPYRPRGKQSDRYASHGCLYTRTTGIWQSVWLEYVPVCHLISYRVYPDITNACLALECRLTGCADVSVRASFAGRFCGEASAKARRDVCHLTVNLSELHLWEVGEGNLYDLEIRVGDDVVYGYFGMREVSMQNGAFCLNGRPVFLRTVLDQGFYPDGVWTAPDEDALVRDIILSMNAGFNGARLHQKVFEPRFLYRCDKLGYLVFGEYGSWGNDYSSIESVTDMLPEWREVIERDFNHPSIIGWCPNNETWQFGTQKSYQRPEAIDLFYAETKALDPTRPCIDTSGGIHVRTDIFDLHDYTQDPSAFAERFADTATGGAPYVHFKGRDVWRGEPLFMSEYGGIGIAKGERMADGTWSYGNAVASPEELVERYRGLTDFLIDNPKMIGFCYTQLYDVEQECNGLYTYEREPKVDIDAIHAINTRRAAIEKK